MHKRTINKNQKPLSDAEIEQHKQFDRVLQAAQTTPWFKNKWFWSGIGAAGVLIAAGWLILNLVNQGAQNKTSPIAGVADKNEAIAAQGLDTFKVSAAGGSFTTELGTTITVPSEAFVDADKETQDSVIMTFRSYHDYADIVHYDIDMNYDSAGTKYRLETGGMFDLYAYDKQGKEVRIASGKSINVTMATPNADKNYNFYTYNFADKEWNYLDAEDSIIYQSEKTDREAENTNLSGQSAQKLKKQERKCTKRIIQLQKNEPVKPIKKEETAFQFSLDINRDEYPGLATFDGLELGLHPDEPAEKKSILKQTWPKMELTTIEKGLIYKLRLEKDNRAEELKVVPLGESELWTAKMEEYQSWRKDFESEKDKLKEIEAEIDRQRREIAQFEQSREKNRVNRLTAEYNETNKKEEPQDLTQWVDVRQQIDTMETTVKLKDKLEAYNNLQRSYTINNTGRYNCDRAIEYPDKQKLQAEFRVKNSEHFDDVEQITLIDQKRNTTFSYDDSDFHSLGLNSRHNNVFFTCDSDGKLYYTPVEQLESIDNKTDQFLFIFVPCEHDISSPEKLRLFLSQLWASA